MNAVGYCRVSTEEQAESGLSLKAQERKIRLKADFCDVSLVECFRDAGVSGKSQDRPGLLELLNRLQGRSVHCVIIYKLDRLTRSVADTYDLVQQFKRRGVRLISCEEEWLDTEGAYGKMMMGMMAVFSEFERDMIAQRTKTALAELKKQGKRAGTCPYGTFADENGYLLENADEQAVISMIRQGRAEGLGWQAIADQITKEGYLTRSGLPFDRRSVQYRARQIGLEGVRMSKKRKPTRDEVVKAFGPKAGEAFDEGLEFDFQTVQDQLQNPKRAAAGRRYEAKAQAEKLRDKHHE